MRILGLLVLLLEIISLLILIKESFYDCKNNRRNIKKNINKAKHFTYSAKRHLNKAHYYKSLWKHKK